MSDDSDRCDESEPASEVDPAFDRYYRLQRVVSEAEWAANLALLHQPLPIALRLNRSSPLAARVERALERAGIARGGAPFDRNVGMVRSWRLFGHVRGRCHAGRHVMAALRARRKDVERRLQTAERPSHAPRQG